MEEFKEEWESVSKIVVIAREGTPATLFSFMAFVLTRASRQYGEGEAVGGCATALVRPTNRRVHLRTGTYHDILICSIDPYFIHRATRSLSRARTNSSRAVRTTSILGVSQPKTKPTTTAQTHTRKPNRSSTRSYAKAASPMPSQHSSPSCVIPCRYLRSSRGFQHARCRRPPAGGA